MGIFPGGGLFPSDTLYPGEVLRVVTETEAAMLASLPPIPQQSIDYQGVMRAAAREVTLLDAAAETVRAQFNPATADVLLPAWEAQLKLPAGGIVGGTDIPTRQQAVLARLRKVLSGGTGAEWEQAVSRILGPGWSYREHDPTDPSSPAAGVIQVTVPFASGSSRFIEAQEQVRDLTDAHLELEFVSEVPFTLDSSELDVSEFGA